jgi:hypothetical protein
MSLETQRQQPQPVLYLIKNFPGVGTAFQNAVPVPRMASYVALHLPFAGVLLSVVAQPAGLGNRLAL